MPSKTVYIETPEMRTAKKNRKQEKQDLFSDVFSNTFGLLLLIVLTYSTLTIAFSSQNSVVIPEGSKILSTYPPIDVTDNPFQNEITSPNEALTPGTTANGGQGIASPETTGNNNAAGSESNAALISGNDINKIAPYFISSMNMVKSQSSSVTNTWKNATNYNNIIDVNGSSVLQKIAQSLMNSFLKEETPNTTYTSRDDINSFFPPAGAGSCNLQTSDIESAECSDNGNTYQITLKLKADTNPEIGQGSGSVANILTQSQITDPVPAFINISNVMCEYQGAVVQAVIEKKTGHILNYYTKLPMVMGFTALSMDGSIGLQFEEKWEVAW